MMIAKVHGGFDKFSGHLNYDSTNPGSSSVDVEVAVASINTREEKRDTHLKSADFFDSEKFPSITFKSTNFVARKGTLKVVGDLTIHGVTASVTLEGEGPSEEMKDPWGNMKIGLSATTKIKRKDFGLTWNAALEAGGFLVGDEVNISVDVQFIKKI
jgi:hypothetical protein